MSSYMTFFYQMKNEPRWVEIVDRRKQCEHLHAFNGDRKNRNRGKGHDLHKTNENVFYILEIDLKYGQQVQQLVKNHLIFLRYEWIVTELWLLRIWYEKISFITFSNTAYDNIFIRQNRITLSFWSSRVLIVDFVDLTE